MIPIGRRVPQFGSLTYRRWASSASTNPDRALDRSPAQPQQPLTGSAKLLAEALEEEETIKSSRADLRHSQGPIWEGEESTHDAVLRMLMDAHKPLRTGEGVRHDTADKKIKTMLKGMDMGPRLANTVTSPEEDISAATTEEGPNPHRTTIPPHLHRPWHSTYTGADQSTDTPQVKYGTFIKRKADGDSLTNLLELQLPPGADGKMRARVRDARRSNKATRRYDSAREGAIDYRLGLGTDGGQLVEYEEMDMDEDDETFKGNRQVRGNSVLGAGKGNASGMKAWGGLVEDRIQRARGESIDHLTRRPLMIRSGFLQDHKGSWQAARS
jgi:aarF domain-containing kinase